MTTTAAHHKSYLASSPYYRSLYNHYGRDLGTAGLEHVLAEHGMSVEDYRAEGQETKDTLRVVMWLGY